MYAALHAEPNEWKYLLFLLILLIIAIRNAFKINKLEKIIQSHDKRLGNLDKDVIDRFINYLELLEKKSE